MYRSLARIMINMKQEISKWRQCPQCFRALVLAGGALFAALCLLPSTFCASRGVYQVVEIKPHIFIWIPEDVIDLEGNLDFARAGNAGFVLSPTAALVVNTTNSPFHARDLAYEIQERGEVPVKYVINTGPEGDEALGNEVFADRQALILSTPLAQAALERYKQDLPRFVASDWQLRGRMRGIHPTPARETFAGQMTIELSGGTANSGTPSGGLPNPPVNSLKSGTGPLPSGGAAGSPGVGSSQTASVSAAAPDPVQAPQEVRLISLHAGRASGDAAVYLPQSKVLFLGDLFENGFYPRLKSEFESRDAQEWITILKNVETWDVDYYVPGHGQPAGKKEVAQFRHFLEWLVGETETRIKEGKSWEQIRDQMLPAMRAYHFRAPERATPALEAIYEQLAPSKPPVETTESGQPGR